MNIIKYTQIRQNKNKMLAIEWCMTHRGNLLCKNAWKRVKIVIVLFEMQQLLYSKFTEKNLSQLYEGIVVGDDLVYVTVKNAVVTRYNTHLYPSININKCRLSIIKTLCYVRGKQKECQDYDAEMRHWNRTGRITDEPIKPAIVYSVRF